MDFGRKVTVQAMDSFSPRADIAEVDAFIREQNVPGELSVSYPGNGGRSAIVFRSKAQVHNGETKVVDR